MKVQTLYVFFILASITNIGAQNSYMDSFWKPRLFTIPVSADASSFTTGITPTSIVSINLTDTVNKVLPTNFGTNSNYRSGSSILNRTSLYTQAKLGEFRYPAGSGSNTFFWDGNGPTASNTLLTSFNPINPGSNDFNPTLFPQFLSATGSQANVVVNYFYARYGKTATDNQVGATNAQKRTARVLQAANYAAGFVQKLNIDLKAKVLNWEVGNECYGGWETGYNVNGSVVTGTEYGQDFVVFAAAMKAVDPTIKIGAVVYPSNVTWTSQVLTQVKNVADFLIVHEYFTSDAQATPVNVLSSVGDIKADMDTVNNWVIKYAGKTKGYYPVALTEYNSRGYGSTNMVNGLFISSILGEIIKNKYAFATSWVNEWNSPGTMSLLAVNESYQPAYTPRPTYMPYYFYGKYFGDQMVNTTITKGTGINVYSSVFSGGEAGLVIVNTNSADQYVQLNVNSTKYNNSYAYWHEMSALNIDSANYKFFINDVSGTSSGGGPDNYTSINPRKAIFANNSILKLKKYSVNYIALTIQTTTDNVNPSLDDSKLTISPNPAKDFVNIKIDSELPSKIEITDISGKMIISLNNVNKSVSIPTNQIGTKGIYFINYNNRVKKLIIQ